MCNEQPDRDPLMLPNMHNDTSSKIYADLSPVSPVFHIAPRKDQTNSNYHIQSQYNPRRINTTYDAMFAAGTYHQMTENPPPVFQYTSYYAPQHRQIMSFSPAANAETLPGGSNQHHTTTTKHSVPPSTWPVSRQQQAPSASQNERTSPNPNPIVSKSTPPSVSAKQSQTTSQPNSASQTLTVTPSI